jgi:hypothetical protein
VSTTFFLFLQTRDLSMQLTNERMRHTAEGSEFMESGGGDGQYMDV